MRLPATPWLIATLASMTLGFSRGLHSSFGVFYVALLDRFDWSRAATAGVFSLNLIVDAILSPIIGHLLDRYGPRNIVAGGCALLGLGLLLSSQIESLWQFYVFFGVISALGLSFTGMVPHVVLVSEWFTSHRASALGAVYAGIGVGIMLLAPLSQWLISRLGWSGAFQTIAAVVLVIFLPLAWGFYRRGPVQRRTGGSAMVRDPWTTRLALRSLQFWFLFIGRVFAAGGTTLIVTHQVAHVVDIGYSRLFAATVFGLVGIMSTGGRFIFGMIADRFSRQAAYTANIATTLLGVGALMLARDPSQTWPLYVYIVFFGIGFGSRAVILSALAVDIFAGKAFGAIYGYAAISVGAGGALGSYFGGLFYDLTGSYLVSFGIACAGLVISDACVRVASTRWVSSYDERGRVEKKDARTY
jgi:MFS family permease